MKYDKLIDELNNLLDSAACEQEKHQKKLQLFFEQFRSEEKKLLKQLKKENLKTNRNKLKKELGVVQKAYTILGAV